MKALLTVAFVMGVSILTLGIVLHAFAIQELRDETVDLKVGVTQALKHTHDHPEPSAKPVEEPDPDKDPECLDGEKIQVDCAPKQRIENKGNRNHCVEVAIGPVGASDALMDKVGFEADTYLRAHVAWLRHGLGTRAKDFKRVVRYYNVTKKVALASCQFLSCSQVWLDVTDDKHPGIERTCKIMKGKQCDH